jgi:MFS family permease
MTLKQLQKYPLLPIFLVVFFGYVGLSIPYSIFSPMFLYEKNSILPVGYPIELRSTLLGIVLALYPFGQFFGLPFLGKISDHFGRKKILLISLFITGICYFFMALSITYNSLWLLMLMRFLCGFSEGNVIIAQSAAADLTDGPRKTRSFSMISMAISLGFIIGPVLGGRLSSPNTVSWFNYSTPFWFSVIVTIFTVIVVGLFFPSSKIEETEKFSIRGLFNFRGALAIKSVPFLYLMSLLLYLGALIFFIVVPMYQAKRFSSSAVEIANILVYISVFTSSTQLILATLLSKTFHPYRWGTIAAFASVFFFVLFLFPSSVGSFYLTLPPLCICMGIVMISINLVISNQVKGKMQGLVMGLNGSIIVIAETLSALLGGGLLGFHAFLPFIIALGVMLTASIMMFIKRKAYS